MSLTVGEVERWTLLGDRLEGQGETNSRGSEK